jgi:ubiquinone/menaquinone biosynthesis C-methylase UbiE
MKETAWDKYWKQLEVINVEKIIENDPYYRLLKRFIRMPKNKRLNILEVGCGSGIRTLALLRDFKKYPLNAVLIDVSLNALLFAKKNAKENKIKEVDFILADGFRLPFLEETFDIVWNEGVNEHFQGKRRQKIFREMMRVCRKGGQVIVIVPNALNLPYRLTKKILEMSGRWIYGFEKPYTIFELKDKMRNVGITPLTTSGAGVIASIFTFLQLINPKTGYAKISKSSKKNGKRSVFKKAFRSIENICEKLFGSILAKDIGVEGTRNC